MYRTGCNFPIILFVMFTSLSIYKTLNVYKLIIHTQDMAIAIKHIINPITRHSFTILSIFIRLLFIIHHKSHVMYSMTHLTDIFKTSRIPIIVHSSVVFSYYYNLFVTEDSPYHFQLFHTPILLYIRSLHPKPL